MTPDQMVERWLDGATQEEIGRAAGIKQVRVSYLMRRALHRRLDMPLQHDGNLNPGMRETLREQWYQASLAGMDPRVAERLWYYVGPRR